MTNFAKLISFTSILIFLAACAGGAANPIVGTWDTVASTPLGDQAATWTINADGTGEMSGAAGVQAIDGITFDGNNLAFDLTIEAQGQSLTLDFSGSVDGDSLSGEFGSDFGAFAVTGTRQ